MNGFLDKLDRRVERTEDRSMLNEKWPRRISENDAPQWGVERLATLLPSLQHATTRGAGPLAIKPALFQQHTATEGSPPGMARIKS